MAITTHTDAVVKNSQLKQYEPAEKEFTDFVSAIKAFKSEIDEYRQKGYSSNQGKARESFFEKIISDLLGISFYNKTNYVGKPQNGDIDLVILDEKSSKSKVKVIFEVKSVDNKAEFPKPDGNGGFDINCKALQETVLYYLRESVNNKNKGISRIVVTNAIEWFIFDAKDFERLFVTGNRQLVKDFENFENNQLSITKTGSFYSDIAQPAIDNVKDQLNYVYFSVDSLTANCSNPAKQKELIDVFKILSPYYLLKKQFVTDSNVLNDKFYKELLHIIGLYETDKDENGKKKKKKTIERLPSSERESGSLLENAILQLSYKSSSNLFERAIQLVIVWINRILFLKLLEAQLVKWHNGDQNYKFLTPKNLPEYDNLKELFFGVIARRPADRQLSKTDMEKYKDIPYLNSSLFEPTEELSIAELKDNIELPLYKGSVLQSQPKNALEYLLLFLDAYDFGADKSTNGLRKQNKTIINASVLGLIFEKINGYKDGSFFTPGTITQYMCKEAIQRAVVQKFNKVKGWKCQSFTDINNQCRMDGVSIEEKNEIINSIRICDPAVGSGHFLVSALNEIIRIKSQLFALCSVDGALLGGNLTIENDELLVSYANGDDFTYNPKLNESQMIQETLFNEKRTIIENCLFGVDINPNSVNICRLRLWIELLKNAYYKSDGTLETLPNIDINIKCGDSLVSRYPIEIGKAVSNSTNLSKEIKDYKAQVKKYKQESNKTEKKKVEETIQKIKAKIVPSIQLNLELDDSDATRNRLAIENNIYHNSMEWMIEFPEVLDDEGRFQGFDVVIGNPPFIDSELMVNLGLDWERKYLQKKYSNLSGNWDMYMAFFELALSMSEIVTFITPDKWLSKDFGKLFRKNQMCRRLHLITRSGDVFKSAKIDSIITLFIPQSTVLQTFLFTDEKTVKPIAVENLSVIKSPYLIDELFSQAVKIINKIDSISTTISHYEKCENACAAGDYYKVKNLIEQNPNPDPLKFYKLINTGTIEKYRNKWAEKEISYSGKYSFPVVEKSTFKNNLGATYIKRADSSKLIFKGLNLLDGFLDEKAEILPGKATLVICSKNISHLKFLLGLLNSKLPIFYIKNKYASNSYCGGISFSKEIINNFPVSATPSQQQPIIDLVDQIITAKQNDPNADTMGWEQKIDLLVYYLYGLTYDEVLIVDPGTAITKELYEALP